MSQILRATKTAAEYRALAAGNHKNAEDSFDRCDTDGFLSQWASGVVAREYEYLADLAEAGGIATVTVLADLDGNEINAKPIPTKHGTAWAILDDANKIIAFAPYKPARPATLAKRGYQEIQKDLPCVIKVISHPGSYSFSYINWPEKWLK